MIHLSHFQPTAFWTEMGIEFEGFGFDQVFNMDPALPTPSVPTWSPKISSLATARTPPRRPFLLGALTVATTRWTRWTRTSLGQRRVTRCCCAEADVADVREQVGIALSELSLGSHDLKSKKIVSQLKSAVKEAKDFAERADDGVQPEMWQDADVILVGPSRTGKTTLANFLARLGLRAANCPLVQGEDIPQNLFHIRRSKLALLTTDADALQSIRRDRMKRLGMPSSAYAGLKNIRRELDWVKMLYTKNFNGFPVINTAKCTIAEAASLVLSHMYSGHVDADTTTRLASLIAMLTHGSSA